MKTALLFAWGLIGFFSALYISRKINKGATIYDMLFLLTLGAMGGIVTLIVGSLFLPDENSRFGKFMDKKLF